MRNTHRLRSTPPLAFPDIESILATGNHRNDANQDNAPPMASAKNDDNNDADSKEPRFRFLKGLLLGLIMGVALGWWFRPPSSFPVDDLKAATERKFSQSSDTAREELANYAEELARKLRENK